jgi:hypothetical protein
MTTAEDQKQTPADTAGQTRHGIERSVSPVPQQAPEANAVIPAPPAAAVATTEPRPNRITIEHLLSVPDSAKREAWISALVEVELARQTYTHDRALAREFAVCGLFSDIKGSTLEQAVATAMVKIQLGRAWGFNQADSIRYIYFVNGRPTVENEIIGAKLQAAGYDWDTEWHEEEVEHKGRKHQKCVGCTLWLKKWNQASQRYEPVVDRNGKPVSVSFTEYHAQQAGLLDKAGPWKQYTQDMYYWRCIGRVKKYHAPHVMRGAISRDEAAEAIPVESAAPAQLPRDLQADQVVPGLASSAAIVVPSLRDKISQHPGFGPPAAETEPDEPVVQPAPAPDEGQASFFPPAPQAPPPMPEPADAKAPKKKPPESKT